MEWIGEKSNRAGKEVWKGTGKQRAMELQREVKENGYPFNKSSFLQFWLRIKLN